MIVRHLLWASNHAATWVLMGYFHLAALISSSPPSYHFIPLRFSFSSSLIFHLFSPFSSVLRLANHLFFLYPKLIFIFLLSCSFSCVFLNLLLGLFSYLLSTLSYFLVLWLIALNSSASTLAPIIFSRSSIPSSLFPSDVECDSLIQVLSISFSLLVLPWALSVDFWEASSTELPKPFLSFSPACDSSSTLQCCCFPPHSASMLMLTEVY